jgi:hypothetical protein
MQGPSPVWLSHTANTAEANGVAELGTKPDLGMTFTENKVLPQKIAGQAAVTMEMNQDYPEVGGWIQTELKAVHPGRLFLVCWPRAEQTLEMLRALTDWTLSLWPQWISAVAQGRIRSPISWWFIRKRPRRC